jgi:hypothetical protein
MNVTLLGTAVFISMDLPDMCLAVRLCVFVFFPFYLFFFLVDFTRLFVFLLVYCGLRDGFPLSFDLLWLASIFFFSSLVLSVRQSLRLHGQYRSPVSTFNLSRTRTSCVRARTVGAGRHDRLAGLLCDLASFRARASRVLLRGTSYFISILLPS